MFKYLFNVGCRYITKHDTRISKTGSRAFKVEDHPLDQRSRLTSPTTQLAEAFTERRWLCKYKCQKSDAGSWKTFAYRVHWVVSQPSTTISGGLRMSSRCSESDPGFEETLFPGDRTTNYQRSTAFGELQIWKRRRLISEARFEKTLFPGDLPIISRRSSTHLWWNKSTPGRDTPPGKSPRLKEASSQRSSLHSWTISLKRLEKRWASKLPRQPTVDEDILNIPTRCFPIGSTMQSRGSAEPEPPQYNLHQERRREKRFRYRGVTVTGNAEMIPPDHVLVSRSNGYDLRRNCSG